MKEFILENKKIKVTILDIGATIYSFVHKETNKNIVLSYKNLDYYKTDAYGYFGTTVGRVAGRISNNSIKVDDQVYDLKTEQNVFLHGGIDGFSFKTFKCLSKTKNSLSLELESDSDSNFPGNIRLVVSYSISHNKLSINYSLKSSKDTPVNITNHSYFNLDDNSDITNHKLSIHSDLYQETYDNYVATGKLLPTNKDYDFSKTLGEVIEDCNKRNLLGVDTYFSTPRKKLILIGKQLSLKIKYSYPGTVLYTGNFFNNEELTNGTYINHKAIAIEPQFPNNGYNLGYPNTLLKAGSTYNHHITYKVTKNK